MPARRWYGTELEHSRSTTTEFLESMVPAVKLVLVHGHHFDHAVHSRLRALERAFDGNAYRARYSRSAANGMHQPEPCFIPHRHLQYDKSDVCQPPPCRHTLVVIPRGWGARQRALRDVRNRTYDEVFPTDTPRWNWQMAGEPTTSPAPHNRYRDGAPPPGFFWLFAIRELVCNKPCVILAASWWVSGDGQCRDETR